MRLRASLPSLGWGCMLVLLDSPRLVEGLGDVLQLRVAPVDSSGGGVVNSPSIESTETGDTTLGSLASGASRPWYEMFALEQHAPSKVSCSQT